MSKYLEVGENFTVVIWEQFERERGHYASTVGRLNFNTKYNSCPCYCRYLHILAAVGWRKEHNAGLTERVNLIGVKYRSWES